MRQIIHSLLKPYYSVAETLGIVIICNAFALSQWWVAVPLLFVWLLLCGWAADHVRASA